MTEMAVNPLASEGQSSFVILRASQDLPANESMKDSPTEQVRPAVSGKSPRAVPNGRPRFGGKSVAGLGLGRDGTKRRNWQQTKEKPTGASNPAIRRLARRAGIKRISRTVYPETQRALREFLEKTIGNTVQYTEYAGRTTVTAMDVVYGLKRSGITIYGLELPRKALVGVKKVKKVKAVAE